MAFKFSTELRKQQCFSGSLKAILDNSVIRLYDGPVPNNADSALTGSNSLLCEITAGANTLTFDPTASSPMLVKSPEEIWQGDVIKTGSVTFFRLLKQSDTGTNTPLEVRIQGTVGGPAEDLTISNTTLVEGAPMKIEYFSIALLEYA